MSRKRSISTDISTDTRVAQLAQKAGPLAVLLFTWLIPHVDDWGRYTADPIQVKLTVLPAFDVSPEEIDNALKAIAEVGLIVLYEVEGKRYLSLRPESFYKYQTYIPASKRKVDNSQYPAPPSNADCRAIAQNATGQRKPPQNATHLREMPQNVPSPSPSLSLSPSVTNVDLDTDEISEGDITESRGVQGGENQPSPAATAAYVSPSPDLKSGRSNSDKLQAPKTKVQEVYTAEFEKFWSLYPRKVEKRAAFKAWRARLREGISPETLICAAGYYAEYCMANRLEERYIKHPATFLGPSRPFEDYLKPRAEPGAGKIRRPWNELEDDKYRDLYRLV